MKNKFVGILLIGLSLLLGFIIISFNKSINDIAKSSCSDIAKGLSCPIVESIDFQTRTSLGIMLFLILFGLYLVFSGKETIVKNSLEPQKISKKDFSKIIENLDSEERVIFENIIEAQGSIFQSELVDKTKFTKVKITRILDKLEGKGLIERKRRGMTNRIILKN